MRSKFARYDEIIISESRACRTGKQFIAPANFLLCTQ